MQHSENQLNNIAYDDGDEYISNTKNSVEMIELVPSQASYHPSSSLRSIDNKSSRIIRFIFIFIVGAVLAVVTYVAYGVISSNSISSNNNNINNINNNNNNDRPYNPGMDLVALNEMKLSIDMLQKKISEDSNTILYLKYELESLKNSVNTSAVVDAHNGAFLIDEINKLKSQMYELEVSQASTIPPSTVGKTASLSSTSRNESLPHLLILLRDDILNNRKIDTNTGDWILFDIKSGNQPNSLYICNQNHSPLIAKFAVKTARECVDACASRRCCALVQFFRDDVGLVCYLRTLNNIGFSDSSSYYYNICGGATLSSTPMLSIVDKEPESMLIARFSNNPVSNFSILCPPSILPFFYRQAFVDPYRGIDFGPATQVNPDQCLEECMRNVDCSMYASIKNTECYLKRNPETWAPLFNSQGDLYPRCARSRTDGSFASIGGFNLARAEPAMIAMLKMNGHMSLINVTDSKLKYALSAEGHKRFIDVSCGTFMDHIEYVPDPPTSLELNVMELYQPKLEIPPTCENYHHLYPAPSRIVVIVPYGRSELIKILINYLDRDIRLGYIYKVKFLQNTNVASDLQFLSALIQQRKSVATNGSDAVTVFELNDLPKIPPMTEDQVLRFQNAYSDPMIVNPAISDYNVGNGRGVSHLLGLLNDSDPSVFYIKIDDDIVFIEDGALLAMLRLKQVCPSHLISANVVNNVKYSSSHQFLQAVQYDHIVDTQPWGEVLTSLNIWKATHEQFLSNMESDERRKIYKQFSVLKMVRGKRLSINTLGFTHIDIRDAWFTLNVKEDDE